MDIFNELNIVLEKEDMELKLTNRINSRTKFYFFKRAYIEKIFKLILEDKVKPENKNEENFFNRYKILKKKYGNKVSEMAQDYNENFTLQIYKEGSYDARIEIPKKRFLKILDDNIREINFIDTNRISEEELKFTLYKISFLDEGFNLEKVESKSISLEIGKGFKLEEDLDSFVEFIKKDDIDFFKTKGIDLVRDMVFDIYSYEKAFDKIYYKIKLILDRTERDFREIEDIFKAFYYYSFNDYYYYMEAMIKLEQEESIYKANPVLTNGNIPKVSDIKVLNATNAKIIKNSKMFRKDDIELAIKFEELFGVNELNIFLETITSLNKLGLASYFEGMANDTIRIMKTFKITMKNLMDRMIREVFYNHLRGDEFLKYVVDYIEMCKMLKIKIEDKLPKDVIRRHDLLVLQLKDISKKGNSKIDKAFEIANKKNINLLKYAPKGTNLKIYCPESVADLVEKGFKANHCVGSYSSRIIDGSSKIFFVEEEDVNGAYFTTFELNKNNDLIQAKGFSNTTPRPDVMKFIKNFIENIKKEEN